MDRKFLHNDWLGEQRTSLWLTSMANNRPPIPEHMKREVRQRCGFGCVICGLPLYEYEHMEGWAIVQRHEASEITLLCDQHHREKTNGLLPLASVREADRNPHNKRAGVSHPYKLHYAGSSCEVVVGSNHFKRGNLIDGTVMTAVAIDGISLLAFTFDQGYLFITLQVFDEQSQRVLWIEQNELRYCPTPWDIRLEGCTLTVREGHGKVLTEIVFSPPNRLEVCKGRFSLNGLELLVEPDMLCYVNNGNIMSQSSACCDVAIMVGEKIKDLDAGFFFPEVNRGHADREAARQRMKKSRSRKKNISK